MLGEQSLISCLLKFQLRDVSYKKHVFDMQYLFLNFYIWK